VYFQVRGSNIHETVIWTLFFVFLEVLGDSWASTLVARRLFLFLICTILVKLTFLTH